MRPARHKTQETGMTTGNGNNGGMKLTRAEVLRSSIKRRSYLD